MSEIVTRLTALGALTLSSAALTTSLWAVGCSEREAPAEEVRPVTASVPAAPESPKPAGVEPQKPSAEAKSVVEPEVAPAPDPAPSKVSSQRAEVAAGASSLKIKRLVVTTGIEKREPVEADAFRAGSQPVYAFVEMQNAGSEDERIIVTFEHAEGREVGKVELEIPAEQRRWRTWGRTRNVDRPGTWEAVIRTASGKELGRTSFEVQS